MIHWQYIHEKTDEGYKDRVLTRSSFQHLALFVLGYLFHFVLGCKMVQCKQEIVFAGLCIRLEWHEQEDILHTFILSRDTKWCI